MWLPRAWTSQRGHAADEADEAGGSSDVPDGPLAAADAPNTRDAELVGSALLEPSVINFYGTERHGSALEASADSASAATSLAPRSHQHATVTETAALDV